MCETEGTPTSLHRDGAAADDVGEGTLQIVTLRKCVTLPPFS